MDNMQPVEFGDSCPSCCRAFQDIRDVPLLFVRSVRVVVPSLEAVFDAIWLPEFSSFRHFKQLPLNVQTDVLAYVEKNKKEKEKEQEGEEEDKEERKEKKERKENGKEARLFIHDDQLAFKWFDAKQMDLTDALFQECKMHRGIEAHVLERGNKLLQEWIRLEKCFISFAKEQDKLTAEQIGMLLPIRNDHHFYSHLDLKTNMFSIFAQLTGGGRKHYTLWSQKILEVQIEPFIRQI